MCWLYIFFTIFSCPLGIILSSFFAIEVFFKIFGQLNCGERETRWTQKIFLHWDVDFIPEALFARGSEQGSIKNVPPSDTLFTRLVLLIITKKLALHFLYEKGKKKGISSYYSFTAVIIMSTWEFFFQLVIAGNQFALTNSFKIFKINLMKNFLQSLYLFEWKLTNLICSKTLLVVVFVSFAKKFHTRAHCVFERVLSNFTTFNSANFLFILAYTNIFHKRYLLIITYGSIFRRIQPITLISMKLTSHF